MGHIKNNLRQHHDEDLIPHLDIKRALGHLIAEFAKFEAEFIGLSAPGNITPVLSKRKVSYNE